MLQRIGQMGKEKATISTTRRGFLLGAAGAPCVRGAAPAKPNILWITCEDMGPHLHACGDDYSVTPNLDKLCQRGSIYMNAWSNAPVCAPARTTIISGVYPTSTGSEHMRSMTVMPARWKMFPGYLREAGYYCANNVKEDYNLEKPAGTWDESSNRAHWRNRASGQPFFSVFNFTITHESQIRTRPHTWIHDPAKVHLPAYHPDTIEVRQDWAQYYDNITAMDGQAGRVLADLEKDGLADNTIVFFFGDHGSGMPRSKRWPYNSGLNVSIVVSIPEKLRALAPKDYVVGTKNDRLVGFIDLAPTMLSLAGLRPPEFYQGQAFLGQYATSPRTHSFGFRGRMDERYDRIRSVRNQRFVYIRNYAPDKIYGQHLAYMWETPTTRVWERLYKDGKLNAAQRKFWEPKPPEELYDLASDRDEINNLASSAAHKPVLEELRTALREHELRVRDIGMLPEAEMHRRTGNRAPYDLGHDPKSYPLKRILEAAELASSMKPGATASLMKAAGDADSGVRYWGVTGILMRGESEFRVAHKAVTQALTDSSPSVRIVAAEAMGRFGTDEEVSQSLETLVKLADTGANGIYVATEALNAIDALGKKAAPFKDRIVALAKAEPNGPERVAPIIGRLHASILSNL